MGPRGFLFEEGQSAREPSAHLALHLSSLFSFFRINRTLKIKGSHVSDNDPAVLAREMTKAMEGHTPTVMPGTPGWNEKLSSDSEAIVKAERAAAEEGGQDVAADVKVLVKHTVTVLREEAIIDRMVGEGVPEREKK